MAARRDEDQDRIKRLEDSLKKVCVDLQTVISGSKETSEKLERIDLRLNNLLKMVTLREIMNTWKDTSKGRHGIVTF
jgi:archaellum component FlaC